MASNSLYSVDEVYPYATTQCDSKQLLLLVLHLFAPKYGGEVTGTGVETLAIVGVLMRSPVLCTFCVVCGLGVENKIKNVNDNDKS